MDLSINDKLSIRTFLFDSGRCEGFND